MLKKILILLFLLICLVGCTNKINQNDNIERIYLTDKYYNNGEFIKVSSSDLTNLDNETYVLFVYNNYCNLPIPCEDIFQEFMNIYKINFLSIPYAEYKDNKLVELVRYAPSIIIVNKGEIVAYLDANKDSDLNKYQDVNEFSKWMNKYIYFQNSK